MIFKSFLIFVSQDNRHYRLSHHWLTRQCGRTFIVKLIIPNIQFSHSLTVRHRSPRQLRHNWHWNWELSRKRSQPRQRYRPQLVCRLHWLSGHHTSHLTPHLHDIYMKEAISSCKDWLCGRNAVPVTTDSGTAVSSAPRETETESPSSARAGIASLTTSVLWRKVKLVNSKLAGWHQTSQNYKFRQQTCRHQWLVGGPTASAGGLMRFNKEFPEFLE